MDIQGHVFDETGAPISGATVTYYAGVSTGTPSPSLGSTTTNADGLWQFTGLSSASYDVKAVYGSSVRWYKGDELPPAFVTDEHAIHPANTGITTAKIVWGSTTVNIGGGVRTKNIPAFNHGGGFATSAVLALFHVDQTNLSSGMLPLSVHTNPLNLTQLGFDIYFYAADSNPHNSVTITWAVLGY